MYRAKNNETLSEISEAFDIDLRELQTHNEGIPGCDIATGMLHADARLKRGTGVWVPDDAVLNRVARKDIYSATGAAPDTRAAAQAPVRHGWYGRTSQRLPRERASWGDRERVITECDLARVGQLGDRDRERRVREGKPTRERSRS